MTLATAGLPSLVDVDAKKWQPDPGERHQPRVIWTVDQVPWAGMFTDHCILSNPGLVYLLRELGEMILAWPAMADVAFLLRHHARGCQE